MSFSEECSTCGGPNCPDSSCNAEDDGLIVANGEILSDLPPQYTPAEQRAWAAHNDGDTGE